jgi:hypothetical protein
VSNVSIWTPEGEPPATLPHFDQLADLHAFCLYLGRLAEAMGLWDWSILVRPEAPEEDEVYACVQPTMWQRRATLRVDHGVRSWPLERLRRVMVHELVHCHLDRMDSQYRVLLDELGPQARRVAEEAWRALDEEATDDIATAWAERLPLIEWPTQET